MDELNQVLERMQTAFAEREQNLGISPMPLHGSTSEGGNPTTLQSKEVSQNQPEGRSQQRKQSFVDSQKLKDSPGAKAQLGAFLLQCYDALNTYGKTPDQLENYTKVFILAMGEYAYEDIRAAFIRHIQTSTNLPMPADIINIINPPKPKLSTAMYIKIMKECTTGGKFLCGENKEFIRAYEAQEMEIARGGSDDFREAQKEIENHRMLAIEID